VEQNLESILDSRSLLLEIRQQAVGFQMLIAAALTDFAIPFGHNVVNGKSSIANQNEPDPYSPWKSKNGFRN
jgi:hypothetical protein